MTDHETIVVMPREMRMMAERILSLTTMPKGFSTTLPDLVMYSQALGLGGFSALERDFPALEHADPSGIFILEGDKNGITVNAAGQHAWIVIPSLLDLLGEAAAKDGKAHIAVINCRAADELPVAAALGRRHGLVIEFDSAKTVFTAGPLELSGNFTQDDPLLWSLLVNGTPISADLWWRIYNTAKRALAPDTVVSRRHAGPMIVNEDGSVIGRKDNDDETDVSFLASKTSSAIAEKENHS